MSESTDNARSILAQQHTQWLESGVTKKSQEITEDMLNLLILYAEKKAADSTIDANEVRYYVGQAAKVRQLKKQLYDTKAFVERAIPAE